MSVYKNMSTVTKRFRGVTFEPGDIKEVPGYIDDPRMIRLASIPVEPPKVVEPTKVTEPARKPKKKEEEIIKEELPNGTDNNQ